MRKFSFVLLALFVLLSCKNAQTPAQVEIQQNNLIFEPIVYSDSIQTIVCTENAGLTYTLFLPEAYKSSTKLPIIFIFDPHAEGKLPIEKYKTIANKYGYILAASNNSKNGMNADESISIANILVNDCAKRLNIDENRMLCMGFSGGARVAAVLAMQNTKISSLILCGAGFQPDKSLNQRNISIFMLAGNTDFNLLELESLNQMLESTSTKHDLISFSGKHEWPVENKMELIFQRYEVLKMADKTINMDSKKLKIVEANIEKEITLARNSKNSVSLVSALQKKVQYLSSFQEVKKEANEISILQSSAKYKIDQEKQNNTINAERQLQQEYIGFFTTKDLDWWEKEAVRFAAIAKKSNPNENDLIQLRLKAYLGLGIYSYANNAIKTNDINASMNFISIYGILEPENPEPYIMKAIIDFRANNVEEAVESLQQAIKRGFKDEQRLLTTPEFAPLQDTPFQLQLLDEMRAQK